MMKIGWIALLIIMFSSYTNAQQLNNKIDSVSYALGVMVGENIKNQGIDNVNLSKFIEGIKAITQDSALMLNRDQAVYCLNEYIAEMKSKENEEKIAEQTRFLERNSRKEDVVTLASGLQYKVIEMGPDTLKSPSPDDKVLVHYEGKLIDGTIVDSSIERGEPMELSVGGVVKGWQEALQLMKPGDKWELYIPYNLAYGDRGAGGVIPPYATLIFRLELLNILE